MVTIIAIVEVKEGKMEEAKEVLKEMALQVKQFYEKYESGEAMKSHMASLAKTSAKLTPLLVPGMDLKTCFEII